MAAPHEPVLDIFQMSPGDGSIQAGGPFYTCMECGDRRVTIRTDQQGRERPTHSDLSQGDRVRVIHRAPEQGYDRMSVLTFLEDHGDGLTFSARPKAGTQIIPRAWIRRMERVSAETPISLNERAS